MWSLRDLPWGETIIRDPEKEYRERAQLESLNGTLLLLATVVNKASP